MLAQPPATARHIAFQLCQRLVADEPPPALVERVAQRSSRPAATCGRPSARSSRAPSSSSRMYYRAKIKSPFEYVVSALRAVGGSTDGRALAKEIAEMGEPLYLCQPPTGYSDTAEAWVNTGALVARLNFALALAGNSPGTADPPWSRRGRESVDGAVARGSTRRPSQGRSKPSKRSRGPRTASLSVTRASSSAPRIPRGKEGPCLIAGCFLKSSGLALVAGGFIPNVFVRMAEAGTPPPRRVLVAIFQRGAVDGLNVLVPYGEKTYYDARPSIAVPRPGSGANAALDLDGFFGLHPSLAPLVPLLPGPLGRLRARRRQPRRDALALRRAGLHGVGHAGRQVHDRRLPLAGARREEGDPKASPLRAVAMSPGHAAHPLGRIRRDRDDQRRPVRHPRRRRVGRRGTVLRVHVRRRGGRHAAGHRAGVLRGRADRPVRGPVADRAGKRRRIPARAPSASR